jgi:hypothetical protein
LLINLYSHVFPPATNGSSPLHEVWSYPGSI